MNGISTQTIEEQILGILNALPPLEKAHVFNQVRGMLLDRLQLEREEHDANIKARIEAISIIQGRPDIGLSKSH